MATAKKKDIEVYAVWGTKNNKKGDTSCLWGINFDHDGKGFKAKVCPELFKSLLDSEKVIKA